MRQIFLDTETTGLSPTGGDRILNLACVEMLQRKVTGNDFHCYINPERDSHEDALRVQGLTNRCLRLLPVVRGTKLSPCLDAALHDRPRSRAPIVED